MGSMETIFKRFLLCLVCALSVTALALGCDNDDADLERADEIDSEIESPVDMLSSATPGRVPFLNQGHGEGDGFKKTDCGTCHQTIHTSGYRNGGDCSYCHGSNGAPLRKSGHQDSNCRDGGCHSVNDKHDVSGFDSPNDCRGCHRYAVTSESTECTHTEEYDVIVIGAGGGGLSAALTLAEANQKVLLVEQSYKTGGCMNNFNRGEYRFEASLHATDQMTMPMALKSLGIDDQVTLHTAETMYKVVFPDYSIEIPADVGEYRALLKSEFPSQAPHIDSIFDSFENASRSMNFADFANLTVTDVLTNHGIVDERLFMVLTSLSAFAAGGPNELPAGLFVAMWNSYHVFGYAYPEGGSQAITTAITEKILDNFGTIKLHTMVDKINIENGLATGIHTTEGGCYKAPKIISNVNIPDTYLKLVGEEHLPKDVVDSAATREPAPGITMLYLGVNDDYSHLFPDNTHEIFVFKDYDTGAMDLDTDACDLSSQGFGLSNYTMLDPENAPPGRSVIVVTTGIGYECYDQWKWNSSYDDYKELKKKLADHLLPRLEKYLPGITTKIEVMEVATPQTVEAYTMNPKGSWEGFDDIPPEMANNPMGILSDENHRSPIPNLYVTGAWAIEGAQSVVLNSGNYVANMLLGE